MKGSIAIRKAFAFLIDNLVIYIVASVLATFLNPYAHSSQNRLNFAIIYVVTLIVYTASFEAKYKKTFGRKILRANNNWL